ncbi:Replicative DNA helicase [subsurface metagenome]
MIEPMKLYNVGNEQIIIGCIILGGNKILEEMIGIVNEEDFSKEDNKYCYRLLKAMYKKNIPIDLATATEYISTEKLIEYVNVTYLSHCMMAVPTIENLTYYIKILKDYSYKRAMLYEIGKFKDDQIDPEKLMKRIINIPKYEEIKEKSNKEIMLETIEDANRGMDFEFPENFRSIKGLIGGIDRGNLVVIGGYPSNGKSSLMINLAYGFVNELQYKVLITTIGEMSPKENMRRIEAIALEINTMKFKTKSLTEKDQGMIKAMIPHINEFWKYNCVRAYTMSDIVRAVNKYEPDILFIDYLQNISGDDALSLYAKRTKHTLEIQRLTKEKNITTFLLSQFHRPPEGRIRRPYNNDFRDSGVIEERADIIFLIYWERKLKMENLLRKDGDAPEFMELNLTKSKDGATGGLSYNYYPEYHKWIDPRDEEKQEAIRYKKAKEISEGRRKDIYD